MSTATPLHVSLTIPQSLVNTNNYTIQFSLHNVTRNDDIFLERLYAPSDLTTSTQPGAVTATFQRQELPTWIAKEGDEEEVVELKAHFWKGAKCIETVDCGKV